MFIASGEFCCLLAISFVNVWTRIRAGRTSPLIWILPVLHSDGIFLEKKKLSSKSNPTIGFPQCSGGKLEEASNLFSLFIACRSVVRG